MFFLCNCLSFIIKNLKTPIFDGMVLCEELISYMIEFYTLVESYSWLRLYYGTTITSKRKHQYKFCQMHHWNTSLGWRIISRPALINISFQWKAKHEIMNSSLCEIETYIWPNTFGNNMHILRILVFIWDTSDLIVRTTALPL